MKLKIEIDLVELMRQRQSDTLYEALDACFEQLLLDVSQPGALGDEVVTGGRPAITVGKWELE